MYRSFFSSADGSLVLRKNNELEFRGPIFADLRRFSAVWALLLKIQSAITPSILGVRGSSSDNRKLSPIPFDYTPLSNLKHENTKKILDPKQTVILACILI